MGVVGCYYRYMIKVYDMVSWLGRTWYVHSIDGENVGLLKFSGPGVAISSALWALRIQALGFSAATRYFWRSSVTA